MAPIDPHSFTDSTHPLTTHISLTFYFDFPSSTISSATLVSFSTPYTGPLTLDTRSLSVSSVLDPLSLSPLPFSLSPTDPILGQSLNISISKQTHQILILSKTSPSSSALQWLSPTQTFNKNHPFLYTHCQPIHARSIFPCQDTPAARVKYTAKLNIPRELSAVMGARHVERRDPIPSEGGGLCEDEVWCGDDRVVEEFVMEQPIPPYLFAFAIGELGFREVGPRTRVYAEAVPEVLDAAATEFAGTEEIVMVGERLFGPYEWERFDLLVLPPSFPLGGMENPRLVFLTPTVIKGDASGSQVVAHELAHGWTGNLITNKNNEHFWLNEGKPKDMRHSKVGSTTFCRLDYVKFSAWVAPSSTRALNRSTVKINGVDLITISQLWDVCHARTKSLQNRVDIAENMEGKGGTNWCI